MPTPRRQKPPTEKRLLQVLWQDDEPLLVVVRGHQFLDELLNVAISQALAVPHAVEVGRVSFPLKIDFAVALRIIPEDCRSAYMKINNIRNRFAHNSGAKFTRRHAQEAYNTLAPGLRRALGRETDLSHGPIHTLRRCIQLLFFVIRYSIEKMRDDSVRSREWAEIVDEELGPISPAEREALEKNSHNLRVEDIVRREREKRRSEADI